MITGRRIDLRPVEPDDAAFLHELGNDRTVTQALVGWALPSSRWDREEELRRASSDANTRRLIILERDEAPPAGVGRPVGLTGLWQIDHREGTATTGIRLRSDAGGRGLGTDAVMTVMAWAFHDVGLRRLEGSILDFNAASFALYVDRCGWSVEGREREAVFRGGRWCDRYRVAILRPEFDALTDARAYVDLVVGVDTNPVARRPLTHG